MVYNTQNYWLFFLLCPLSGILNLNTTFWKLDLFPSSGEWETPMLLGSLETANLNHWSTSLIFRILDDGQSPKKTVILRASYNLFLPAAHFRILNI
jgi:hypothetical protein